jgi:hypothetical protein
VTSERAKAYGRIMEIVQAEGPQALEPDEQALLREAADALLFCEDISFDEEAREALAQVSDLTGTLVGTERWDAARAEEVLRELEACGPAQLVRLGS